MQAQILRLVRESFIDRLQLGCKHPLGGNRGADPHKVRRGHPVGLSRVREFARIVIELEESDGVGVLVGGDDVSYSVSFVDRVQGK